MTSFNLLLAFSPEQAAALRREYALLSQALEKRGALEAEQLTRLRAAMTEALTGQQSADPGFLERLREDARVRANHIHLSTVGAGDDLLDLPWHLLAVGSPNLLISKGLPLRQRPSIAKGLPSATELEAFVPDLALPLKILVMVAAPENTGAGRLRYEEEEKIILDALSPLMRSGEVEVEFTDDGSLESLRRALAANQ